MKTFQIGDEVKVIMDGENASQFTSSKYPLGVYSLNNWENIIFKIAGEYAPVKYNSSPEIYGAYPLSYNGELIGYVYNTGLQLASDVEEYEGPENTDPNPNYL